MKNLKTVLAAAGAALCSQLFAVSYTEDTEISGQYELAASTEFNIADGVTVTFSGSVVDAPGQRGSIILTGGGTLAFTLPSNTFSGGADAPEGTDRTYASHFSGAGTLKVFGGMIMIVK